MIQKKNNFTNDNRIRISTILVPALALFALFGTFAVYRQIVPNHLQSNLVEVDQSYNPQVLQDAVAPERVQGRLNEIKSFGSRFLGQPGFYKTEDYIRDSLRSLGLEVHEQQNYTVAPVTAYREIALVDERGGIEDLPNVKIYTFQPNMFQPVVTPPGGLTGELVLMSPEILATRKSFDDCIGLIDITDDAYDENYEFVWIRYATLGIKGLIFSGKNGFQHAEWEKTTQHDKTIRVSSPINYVRVAATHEIFDYVGKTIRLKVRADMKEVSNRSLFGILKSPAPSEDALVVVSHYDALSILPDLAPGVLQAVNPSFMMQLAEGMVPYRNSLKRDVVFFFSPARYMASEGLGRLLSLLQQNVEGVSTDKASHSELSQRTLKRLAPVVEKLDENTAYLGNIEVIRECFEDEAFFRDQIVTADKLNQLSRIQTEFFKEQFTYVINSVIFELSEPLLQTRLAFKRLHSNDTGSREFREYDAVRKRYEESSSMAGYSPENLLKYKARWLEKIGYRSRFLSRLQELENYHNREIERLEKDRDLVELFDPYRNITFLELLLAPVSKDTPSKEAISFLTGDWINSFSALSVQSVLAVSKRRLELTDADILVPSLAPYNDSMVRRNLDGMMPSEYRNFIMSNFGYPYFCFANLNRRPSYQFFNAPVDLPFMNDLGTLENTFSVLAEGILSMAHGMGRLEPNIPDGNRGITFGGRVLAANIGNSMVPNFPLKNALVGTRSVKERGAFDKAGCYKVQLVMTDPYGRFYLPHNAANFANWNTVVSEGNTFTPIACGFDENGFINYMKDEGEEGQRRFKSIRLNILNKKAMRHISIVTFRAAPLTVFDLINPQSLKDYTGVNFLSREGLTTLNRQCVFEAAGIKTAFLEPDREIFLELQSGTPENEYVRETRAFMLGVSDRSELDPNKEIDGDGYLVQDHPFLLDVPFEVSRSMDSVNGKRLDLQSRYSMTDERTRQFDQKTKDLIRESEVADQSKIESIRKAREAVTYATLNHPVLKDTIFEAVLGIMWYLALIVPFVFFFEKMVFCYADIRKQLVAQVVIFLVVFALLRILHPAFEMVRSSIMILLGFIIILISGGITFLFSGKFQENLEELRKKQGKVAAAEVNTFGVMVTAFMLGLNNMHRRKIRTGLTCGTLTLLTFVLISFTSVQNDIVEELIPLGKASYQGMLIKKERFSDMSDSEYFAIENKYGDKYEVCLRRMFVGKEEVSEGKRLNPNLAISYNGGFKPKSYEFDSIIQLSYNEPLRNEIKLLSKPYWFDSSDGRTSDQFMNVIVSDFIARNLGITVQQVNAGGVSATINGRGVLVRGIFDSEAYENLRSMDGLPLLPFDIEQMESVSMGGLKASHVLADDDDPRVPARNVVIAPVDEFDFTVHEASKRTVGVVVSMPGTPYKEALNVFEKHMEQTSTYLYFGIDGVAFKGKRTREVTLAGLLDLLIPLLLGGLTVLNTMRGSVYERKEEIYIYNSVGIAPRYVFFMFIAEAVVYIVVGSVLGYLLSQGLGRILTELGWTGGLNMTYTSITTIYASLAIGVAVLVSTFFPARAAMEIAAPAEDAGWELPEPDGDSLAFDLPFTFRKRGRIAILSFFHRYISDHGEGGAGRFSADEPRLGLATVENDQDYRPFIESRIWLKPFDLGVSQVMTIQTLPDPETNQFKATIVLKRQSGTMESWMRLNKGFVGQLRQQFLHWRAVSPDEREVMYEEAKAMLKTNVESS